jgi:HORMA domain
LTHSAEAVDSSAAWERHNQPTALTAAQLEIDIMGKSKQAQVQRVRAGVVEAQSVQVVKNMIRSSISIISYMRQLFPETCFEKKKYANMEVRQTAPNFRWTKDSGAFAGADTVLTCSHANTGVAAARHVKSWRRSQCEYTNCHFHRS